MPNNLVGEITDFVCRYSGSAVSREKWTAYYSTMLAWGNVLILRNGKKIALVADYWMGDSLTKMLTQNKTAGYGKFMVIQNTVLHPKFQGKGQVLRKALKLLFSKHPETEYVGWHNKRREEYFIRRVYGR